MKYLILGVNGMAGHTIAQYLSEQGHEVLGFAKKECPVCNTITGNALNIEDIIHVLQMDNYDYVVNCIGILNKEVDKKLSEAIYLNSVFPHFLAEQLERASTKLIHISTDCVFDGSKGGYKEQDIPDAKSYYGKSKALGEINDKKNLTIRTSIVGPELKNHGIGLFHWFMLQSKEIYGYEKVLWSGVTTLQLAKAIEMDIRCPQIGVYHLVNNQKISKRELLLLFNKYFKKSNNTILSNTDIASDKSLLNTKEFQPFMVPDYEQMVQEMSEWVKGHSSLYELYDIKL